MIPLRYLTFQSINFRVYISYSLFEYLFCSDEVGKEIISKITTDISSEKSFYTDANGRQTLRRTLNNRQTWDYKITEPVAGNYYPINSHIFVKDKEGKQLTLLVDRAQGGSSLNDGEIELMVHRRLLVDDGFGVGESLNEKAYHKGLVVRGKHYLVLSDEANSARLYRSLSQELYREPQISFASTSISFESWSKMYKRKVIYDSSVIHVRKCFLKPKLITFFNPLQLASIYKKSTACKC